MDERLIHEQTGARCYPKPKPSVWKFGTKVGKLVLTSRRLVFLSTGKMLDNSEIVGAALAGPLGALAATSTIGASLSFEDLRREGSWEVALSRILRAEAGRTMNFRYYLSLTFLGASGKQQTYSIVFGTGLTKLDWHSMVNEARSAHGG